MSTMHVYIMSFAVAISAGSAVTATDVTQTCAAEKNDSASAPGNESTAFPQADSIVLKTGWHFVLYDSSGVSRQLDRSTETYWLRVKPIITGDHIVEFKTYRSKSGELGLSMKLDKDGTNAWSWATGESVGRQLAFVVNNRLLQVGTVMSEITNGMTALNRGIYNEQELKAIEAEVKAGGKK